MGTPPGRWAALEPIYLMAAALERALESIFLALQLRLHRALVSPGCFLIQGFADDGPGFFSFPI